MPSIELIVARTRNGVIGKDNAMPWHLPQDLAYFKSLTMGHPILMGRKTAEAIGRPLPGRTYIVLSRDPGLEIPGYLSVQHPEAAIDWATAQNQDKLFIIGGAQVYTQFMPHAEVLHITEINAEIAGDTYFPEFNALEWRKAGHLFAPADSKNAYDLAFTRWERV